MKSNLIFLVIINLLLLSCKGAGKERLTQNIQAWQGKEVQFPRNLLFTKYTKDAVSYTVPNFKNKISLYVDFMGCIGYKLKLQRWKKFMTLSLEKAPFLFFFQPKDVQESSYLLYRGEIEQPVCVDTKNTLEELNQFFDNVMFHCSLLDANNNVLCIGNHIYDDKIKELYFKDITGVVNKQKAVLETRVGMLTGSVINLGQLNLGINTFLRKVKKIFELIYHIYMMCKLPEDGPK